MAEAARPLYVVILYATLYRAGGEKFAPVARAMAAEKAAEFPVCRIVCSAAESKAKFLEQVESIEAAAGEIFEFHFIGYSGVYGIMFGTPRWPEQFSPYEWRTMRIPFAHDGHFYFHADHTAQWFAPFIARTLHVRASGYHRYTATDPMIEFEPSHAPIDTSYDAVAELYDRTFEDIGVRADEMAWILQALGPSEHKTLLDIGCGNGALLQKLSSRLGKGVGVDISAGMLTQARERCRADDHLDFQKINGPSLPFADGSFDTVISVLSFRYLDWDPIVQEIRRVLKPGGQVLVLDMVAAPVKFAEIFALIKAKADLFWQRRSQRRYGVALRKMVTDPRWRTMLKYNPMRSEPEMREFLESRFPGRKAQVINVGWRSRILAFDTGPVHK
jgi:ubiquinone/menaquinone biosynthesis C-methylase UbiE